MKTNTRETILEKITTSLWQEISEPNDPFSAASCYCAGYDVYGDLLDKASWTEFLFLLFQKAQPSPNQVKLLNGIAIAIGNLGPRDHSIQAAMSASVGGSSLASSLIASLAVGAGNLGGGQEVLHAMNIWQQCDLNLSYWKDYYQNYFTSKTEANIDDVDDNAWEDVWLAMEHPAGFHPYSKLCNRPVQQTLDYLANIECGSRLHWLKQNRQALEKITGMPLSFVGIVAAAFLDLELQAEQGEMLYLLLRLPGAAAHALEQRELGWKSYPFHPDGLTVLNDPAKIPTSPTLHTTLST